MEKSLNERFQIFDENYPRILEEIARAAEKSGRSAQDITLLAATKTVPLEVVNHAIEKGLACIGENRVQELLDKYDGLHKDQCDIQFIGQLQTNKVKYLMGKVSCIQSVGSVKLAKEISRLCQRDNTTMDVLVEVNIGREESKGGVLPEALLECVDEIRTLPGIRVKGLMAIPPICDNISQLCGYFSAVQQSYVDIGAKKWIMYLWIAYQWECPPILRRPSPAGPLWCGWVPRCLEKGNIPSTKFRLGGNVSWQDWLISFKRCGIRQMTNMKSTMMSRKSRKPAAGAAALASRAALLHTHFQILLPAAKVPAGIVW